MTVTPAPAQPAPEKTQDSAMEPGLAALRAGFDARAGRSLSLPLAGFAVWTAAGVAGIWLPTTQATYMAIGLGLHWMVFSWIIRHPVGVAHAVARTILATVLWWLVPTHRVSAVAAGVVLAYAYAVAALARRHPARAPDPGHPTARVTTSVARDAAEIADGTAPR